MNSYFSETNLDRNDMIISSVLVFNKCFVIPATLAPEQKKELTLQAKILKVENLQLVVEKRAKLVQTR